MNKWANVFLICVFFITSVRYDKDHKYIISVKVSQKPGKKSFTKTREEVIDSMKKCSQYITIVKNRNKQWIIGEIVKKITIDRKEFIKTKKNNSKRDNLENLPEY